MFSSEANFQEIRNNNETPIKLAKEAKILSRKKKERIWTLNKENHYFVILHLILLSR